MVVIAFNDALRDTALKAPILYCVVVDLVILTTQNLPNLPKSGTIRSAK